MIFQGRSGPPAPLWIRTWDCPWYYHASNLTNRYLCMFLEGQVDRQTDRQKGAQTTNATNPSISGQAVYHDCAPQLGSIFCRYDTCPTQYAPDLRGSILCMQGTQYAPRESISCMEHFVALQCLHGPINSYHSFWWSNLILCLYNVDTLNICMKEFGSEKNDKMTAVRT